MIINYHTRAWLSKEISKRTSIWNSGCSIWPLKNNIKINKWKV